MGRTYAQLFLDGKLTIPCKEPDIGSILRITTTPIIQQTVSICKHVIFLGCARICLEYVACVDDSSQPVHFVTFDVPFRGFIHNRHARASRQACLQTKLLFQNFKAVDPRTIEKAITLQVKIGKFTRVGKRLPPYGSKVKPCHTPTGKHGKKINLTVPKPCGHKPDYHTDNQYGGYYLPTSVRLLSGTEDK